MLSVRTFLVVTVALSSGACASTGATPRPFPTPGPRASRTPPGRDETPPPPVARPAVDTYALTATALTFRGTRYLNGGADPRGFDCSGFTQYVFGQHGIALPRGVKDQFEAGLPVKVEDIAPGDLLFFTTVAPGASHVGIALGGDEFVHAPSSAGVVRVERVSSSYWAERFIGARRVGD